jgi:hypothetical protein
MSSIVRMKDRFVLLRIIKCDASRSMLMENIDIFIYLFVRSNTHDIYFSSLNRIVRVHHWLVVFNHCMRVRARERERERQMIKRTTTVPTSSSSLMTMEKNLAKTCVIECYQSMIVDNMLKLIDVDFKCTIVELFVCH